MSVELHRLMVGSQAIDYVITRRERKTLEIAVEPDASVLVVAPLDASVDAIEIRLRRRAAWIMRQQRYFSQFFCPERPNAGSFLARRTSTLDGSIG